MIEVQTTNLEPLIEFISNSRIPNIDCHSKIAKIETKFLSTSSCYATYCLTVYFQNETQLKLFVKDFASHQKPREDIRQRARREIYIYRHLLADAYDELGTPFYVGAADDDPTHQFWLALEFVDGAELRYCDFKKWIEAAAWLGRLQSFIAHRSEKLEDAGQLICHDRDFFLGKAELAVREVSRFSNSLSERLGKVLDPYSQLVELMVDQPFTMLHAGYRPKNILVSRNPVSPRICPIDWEMAGTGPMIFDFACLSDGFEEPELHEMWHAYTTHAPFDFGKAWSYEHVRLSVDCFRLHRLIVRLTGVASKNYEIHTISTLIDEVSADVDSVVRMTC